MRSLFPMALTYAGVAYGAKGFGDFYARTGLGSATPRKVVCGGSVGNRPHKALLRWGCPLRMRPCDVGSRVVVEEKRA